MLHNLQSPYTTEWTQVTKRFMANRSPRESAEQRQKLLTGPLREHHFFSPHWSDGTKRFPDLVIWGCPFYDFGAPMLQMSQIARTQSSLVTDCQEVASVSRNQLRKPILSVHFLFLRPLSATATQEMDFQSMPTKNAH